MTVFSLGEFAAHLTTMEADVRLAEEAAVANYRFVSEVLHTLHKAAKEAWDEFGPEDDK